MRWIFIRTLENYDFDEWNDAWNPSIVYSTQIADITIYYCHSRTKYVYAYLRRKIAHQIHSKIHRAEMANEFRPSVMPINIKWNNGKHFWHSISILCVCDIRKCSYINLLIFYIRNGFAQYSTYFDTCTSHVQYIPKGSKMTWKNNGGE